MAELDDHAVARHIAGVVGEALADFRSGRGDLSLIDARALRDEADAMAHHLILELLGDLRPDDAVLSEEGVDDPARLAAPRVWIVDPLDGTWEYGLGRRDWAVHIALWSAATSSVSAAAVSLPDSVATWSTADPISPPRGLPTDRPLRLVVSRSRPAKDINEVAAALGDRLGVAVEVVNVGSVGAKVGELLAGRVDAYVHDSGFHEWDVAAPYAVAQHHGLFASATDGRGLTFNHHPPYVDNLVVATPIVAEVLLSLL
jgi:3'(2'), 5'-bisphosphate nucleotidase